MENTQTKYNEHLVNVTENALSLMIEGMTILIQSQKQIIDKLNKHIQSSMEDSLEISSSLEDIEQKVDTLTNTLLEQEENADEIKIDIEEIKNYIVLVNAVKDRK